MKPKGVGRRRAHYRPVAAAVIATDLLHAPAVRGPTPPLVSSVIIGSLNILVHTSSSSDIAIIGYLDSSLKQAGNS